MPSINMIAVRREEKRRGERTVRRLLYGVAGEVGGVLLLASVLAGRILVAHGQVAELKDKLAKLQPRVQLIQRLQTQTAALEPKVQTLDGAKADTLFWYGGFYAVTASLPDRAWLTSLGTGSATGAAAGTPTPGASSGDDPTLSLTGVALTQDQVSQAMLRMNQSQALDHVDLAFVQTQKQGQTDAVGFQMTVHLKPETPPAKAAGGKPDAAKTASDKPGAGRATASAQGATHDTNS